MGMPKNPAALQAIIEQLAVKASVNGFIMVSSDLASLDGYDHFAAIDTALNVEPEKTPYRYGNAR